MPTELLRWLLGKSAHFQQKLQKLRLKSSVHVVLWKKDDFLCLGLNVDFFSTRSARNVKLDDILDMLHVKFLQVYMCPAKKSGDWSCVLELPFEEKNLFSYTAPF